MSLSYYSMGNSEFIVDIMTGLAMITDTDNADYFVLVGAVAESFGIHLADHAEDAFVFFGCSLGQPREFSGLLGGPLGPPQGSDNH